MIDEPQEQLTNDHLKHVADLTMELEAQQVLVEALEAELAAANTRVWQLQMRELPEALEETGLRSVTLRNGKKLEVAPVFAARIPKALESEAFQWLRDNGYGSLIKELVSVGVHHMTLKAWVKERFEAGEGTEIPEQLFNPFAGMKATVK